MYDKLFAKNEEAIVMHNEIKMIFKKESEDFFLARKKWLGDLQIRLNKQDKLIDNNMKKHTEVTRKLKFTTDAITNLSDSVILVHLVQKNITSDMRQIELLQERPEHDFLMKDRQRTTPKHYLANLANNIEMNKPIIDVNEAVNRNSSDPRAQAQLLSLIKLASFNFRRKPIIFNNNQINQTDVLQINQDVLIKLQKKLAEEGIYNDNYSSLNRGQKFYIKPLVDFTSMGSSRKQ